jgi:hypothetical protein
MVALPPKPGRGSLTCRIGPMRPALKPIARSAASAAVAMHESRERLTTQVPASTSGQTKGFVCSVPPNRVFAICSLTTR